MLLCSNANISYNKRYICPYNLKVSKSIILFRTNSKHDDKGQTRNGVLDLNNSYLQNNSSNGGCSEAVTPNSETASQVKSTTTQLSQAYLDMNIDKSNGLKTF